MSALKPVAPRDEVRDAEALEPDDERLEQARWQHAGRSSGRGRRPERGSSPDAGRARAPHVDGGPSSRARWIAAAAPPASWRDNARVARGTADPRRQSSTCDLRAAGIRPRSSAIVARMARRRATSAAGREPLSGFGRRVAPPANRHAYSRRSSTRRSPRASSTVAVGMPSTTARTS